MNDEVTAPLAPRPPSNCAAGDVRLEPRRPTEKTGASRRALAVLLRQVENPSAGSAADTSDGTLTRAPRRNIRTRAFLKELYSIKSVDALCEHEVQLRNVIESNETRQWAEITSSKYRSLVVREEQTVVFEKEAWQRDQIEQWMLGERLLQLSLLELISEEFTTRRRFQSTYPPENVRSMYTDIQLRRLRQVERRVREESQEIESVLALESFQRHMVELEHLLELPEFHGAVHDRMTAERNWLDLRQEERALLEMQEYVHRDALESTLGTQLLHQISHSQRELRFLKHNDVQTEENHKRNLLLHREESEFHQVVTQALQNRRSVIGRTEVAQLGHKESRFRNELLVGEAVEFRLLATEALRNWHTVHVAIVKQHDYVRVVCDGERLRRVDIQAEYRAALQEIQLKAQAHHGFVAFRDWERRHLMQTYIDGRVALWQQQESEVDEMFQLHSRKKRLMETMQWSTVLDREEKAKRQLLELDQWKVFMLFYLWSAVQRFKVVAVQTLEDVARQEDASHRKLLESFELQKREIQINRTWKLERDEDAERTTIVEQQLDQRLQLYRYFKDGRQDLVRVPVDVGGILISSMEASERKRIELQGTWQKHNIELDLMVDSAILEKKELIAQQEAHQRLLVYMRILEFVGEWYRVDTEYEEQLARVEMEQRCVMDEELTHRVAFTEFEEERFSIFRKIFEGHNIKILFLFRDELETRLGLLADAEVSANSIRTQFACSAPFGGTRNANVPLSFADYRNAPLQRELRTYDLQSFADELRKEIQIVAAIDEPSQRRWIVDSEYSHRNWLMMEHHEMVTRNLIMEQAARELKVTVDTCHRMYRRDDAHHVGIHTREISNLETDHRLHQDIEERSEILQMLEIQEDMYRIAEEQIKLRMLLDEGPILEAYFSRCEEITSVEEIERDTLRCEMLTQMQVVEQLERRRATESTATAATESKTTKALDTIATPPPKLRDVDLLYDTAVAAPSTANSEAPALPFGIVSPIAYRPAYRPATHDLALHSVQVSLLSKMLSVEEPLQVYLAVGNVEKTLIGTEEAQRVVIGSKTLAVLQPIDENNSSSSSSSNTTTVWPFRSDMDVEIEVRLGSNKVLLRNTKHFDYHQLIHDPQQTILCVPLLCEMTGATGKANFIIDVK